MDDRDIIELYWRRDALAIDRTAEKYGSYCTKIAWNILQNEEDAEECVNDTWLGAWNSIPPQRPNRLAAFLGKLARCKAIDRWRTQTREKRGGGSVTLALEELSEVLSTGDGPEQTLLQKELQETANRFLASLSSAERDVFLCRYWYFDSLETISEHFGFSLGKVKSMLLRLRKRLREKLEKEELI